MRRQSSRVLWFFVLAVSYTLLVDTEATLDAVEPPASATESDMSEHTLSDIKRALEAIPAARKRLAVAAAKTAQQTQLCDERHV